ADRIVSGCRSLADLARRRAGPSLKRSPGAGKSSRPRPEPTLARNRAAVLAGVEGLVRPRRLDGVLVPRERDVLEVVPGALVGVLTRRRVVPAVLDREEVVRIGDGLGVLVADDDRVAVEDAVPEGVRRRIDAVGPAAADHPVHVQVREERVLV